MVKKGLRTVFTLVVFALLSVADHIAAQGGSIAAPVKWLRYAEAEKYGLALPVDLAETASGPLTISFSSRDGADCYASLKDTGTGVAVADIVSTRRSAGGWSIELGFPASGSYELTIWGKPASSSEDKYYALARTTIVAVIDLASNWTFAPGFARLGLVLSMSPKLEVGESADILIAAPAGVSFRYRFAQAAATASIGGGVSMASESGGWRFGLSFPESGDYVFALYAKAAADKDYRGVSTARFKAGVSSAPPDKLARALRLKDAAMIIFRRGWGRSMNYAGLSPKGKMCPIFIALQTVQAQAVKH